MSSGRPLKILFDQPGDVLKWRPGNVLSDFQGGFLRGWFVTPPGRSQDVPRGRSKHSNLDVPNFLLTFLSELIPLIKSILKHFNNQGVLRTQSNF